MFRALRWLSNTSISLGRTIGDYLDERDARLWLERAKREFPVGSFVGSNCQCPRCKKLNVWKVAGYDVAERDLQLIHPNDSGDYFSATEHQWAKIEQVFRVPEPRVGEPCR